MKLFEFNRDILLEKEKEKEKKEPLPDKKVPEKPVPEKDFGEHNTNEFEKKVLCGFASYGCVFLFKMVNELTNQLKNSKDKGESKFVQTRIEYIEKGKNYQKCKKEITKFDVGKEPVKDKEKLTKEPETTVVQEPQKPPTQTPTTTPTTYVDDSKIAVQTQYENPQVITSPLYGTESEITDINTIQTDEYIDDMVINLETQILNQSPEVQEKLKEYNLDAEKMAKLVPLTRETKDFMMMLDMEGIKLPHLMVLYDNLTPFYDAIRYNTEMDNNKLIPLTKVINYNEFWDWVRLLWDRTSEYLIEKVSGSIPELGEEFTVLP